MITKMDKYSFILFHTDLSPFLEKVQELGMVDITRENKAMDQTSRELFANSSRYSKAINSITNTYNSFSPEFINTVEEKSKFSSLSKDELLKKAETLLQNREQFKHDLESLTKEYRESRPWGIIDQEDLTRLKEMGYTVHLYNVSEKNYKVEWETLYPIQILNTQGGRVYFAILSTSQEEFSFEINESKIPNKSYHVLEAEIASVKKNIENNNRELVIIFGELSRMEKAMEQIKEKLDLYLAGASSIIEAEGSLAILTGFAPAHHREELATVLNREGVYHIIEDAVVEDNPPVKLKNGFFSRLYEPIGELYMLPTYGELDLTPYFAPFYMLFFGFCLGDMGYGLTILIAAGLAKYKFPKFKAYLTLSQFLGVGAIIMAALSGVFFGMKIQDIIPMPQSIQDLFFSDLKMFWFAIIFGLVQIVFARMINAVYSIITKGWQYGMHNIGWSIVIIWAAWFYATTMSTDIIMPSFANWIALFGAVLIFLFTSDSGNIFTRLFKGIFAFYDVTSVFGDMLSYIRLFGLGTAGAILGMVVNSVAMSLIEVPYIGWLFALLMLVFGHIMVLLLSSLGAFVHPMRLTFVEFYKNANFGGGGRAFRPLEKDLK